MSYDQGAAALAPREQSRATPKAPAGQSSGDGNRWENASFDVTAQIGEKGWRTDVELEGVDDPEAFIAFLEGQYPATKPLHELPYAMDLLIINWGHFHAGLGDDPEVRHVFTEKTPDGDFKVVDMTELGDLDTYKRDPATIAHLRR